MLRNAWLEVRRHPSRITALVLAIAISVAFLVTTVVFFGTETRSITSSVTARTAASDVVVEAPEADPVAAADQLSAVAGVDHTEVSYQAWLDASTGRRTSFLTLYSVPTDERLQWADLAAGAWPSNDTEVVLGTETAQGLGVSPGDSISVPRYTDTGEEGDPVELTVTGIAATHSTLLSGAPEPGFASSSLLDELDSSATLLVIGDGSVSPDELADRLRDRQADAGIGPDATVQTQAEYEAQAVEDLTGSADTFRTLLLSFCVIALLVGCIIIANTFTILIAQRRRQVGLLRTIGAEAAQVRRGLLIEAALIGLIGAALGIGAGIGVGAGAAAISGSLVSGLVVPPGWLLAALLIGVAATVLSALVPTRRAMRIAPLEVLRPANDAKTHRRTTWTRIGVVLTLLVGGTALVATGLVVVEAGSGPALLLAIAGSALLSVGILTAAPFFVPPVLRGVGRLISGLGPTARLAATNTVRNPGRAAATCTALMLAIGLIVTLQVGSASIRTTLTETIDEHYPVDLSISRADGSPIEEDLPDTVGAMDQISDTQRIPGTSVTWTEQGQSPAEQPGSDQPETESIIHGIDPSDRTVVRGGLDDLTDDRVLMNPSYAAMMEIEPGTVLTLDHDGTRTDLTVWLSPVAQDSTLVVTAATLATLDPDAADLTLWAQVSDTDQARAVMDDLQSAIDADTYVVVGSLPDSALISQALDIMLGVATGLLGVAVVIALIGVGNTLGLSVIERTRESALLRALGLQRASLRTMLAVEAVLLALVGALVGILAGVLFGWIGTLAVSKLMEVDAVHFAVSLPQTAAMIVIALLAGLAASVLPARRAAMAAPTEALAEV